MFTAEERRQYIGGSDIAVVMGMSRWKTPLSLWLEKTGDAEPTDLSENESVQLGIELEEFVAQKFAKKLNKQVRKTSKMYIHKKYPFMAAHVDRLIVGEDELLECKTCASYKQSEWEEETKIINKDGKEETVVIEKIPQEYLLQCVWYMGITGKKTCYIAVLIGGQQFKYRKIEFDKELFDIMVEMAIRFWDCVQTHTLPSLTPSDNPIMADIYPTSEDEYIENQEFEEKIEQLQKIKTEIKALENEKDLYEAELKNIINTHAGIITEKYKVSWLNVSKTVPNTELLKADNLYEKYTKISNSRRLNINQNKQKAA